MKHPESEIRNPNENRHPHDGARRSRRFSARVRLRVGILPARFAFGRRCGVNAALLLLSVFSFQLSTFSQSYSIDWSTIDGGGGTSTGGVYSVSGTIGQPDAGPTMSGGNFSVDGGFWGLIAAVQTPGAPTLSIARTTTNTVTVFWPSPSTGWMLQQNTNSVASVNWSNALTTPTDDGTNKTVIVNPPTGNRFYRLFKP